MALFNIPQREINSREKDKALINKAKTKAQTKSTIRGGNSLMGKLNLIQQSVDKALGKYKNEYTVIRDLNTFHNYISDCIATGEISIDTETTG